MSYFANVTVVNTGALGVHIIDPIVHMGYTPNGGAGNDAFGRLRTSNPYGYFQSKMTNNQSTNLMWDFQSVGNGSHVFNTASATYTQIINGNAGDRTLSQTRQYMHYQPGTSLLFFVTFNFKGPTENVAKRIGYFDEKDGYYVELSGSNLYLVERSSVSVSGSGYTEVKISQSAWNIDKFDGTGISGGKLDLSSSIFFALDFEWLGVGSVRAGFLHNNTVYYAHRFDHVNSVIKPYMRTANLPVRMSMTASAPAFTSSFDSFCCSVINEGSSDPLHVHRSVDRGITTLTTDTTLRSVAQIRLKDGYNNAVVPVGVDVICTTPNSVNYQWMLLMNPTFDTTGVAPSWVSSLSSSLEYDVSSTYTITNEGIKVASGYVSSDTRTVSEAFDSVYRLGRSINDFKDTLVLAVRGVSGGNQTYLGSIEVEEVI